MATNEFDEFLKVIEPWKNAYGDVTVRYLGARIGNEMRLVQVRATFVVVDQFEPMVFESKSVIGGRFSHRSVFGSNPASGNRETYLSRILRGEFIGPEGSEFKALAEGCAAKLWRYHPEGLAQWGRLTVLSATYGASGIAKIREGLDWELKASSAPYDSLIELANDIGLHSAILDTAQIDIVALRPAQIEVSRGYSTVDGTKAKIVASVAPGLDKGSFSIGYKVAQMPKTISRGTLAGDAIEWTAERGWNVATSEIEVVAGATVQAFAVVGGHSQHQQWIAAPNAFPNRNRTALSTFDPDLNTIRSLLFDPQRKGGGNTRAVESAVGCLLWMLGFSVLQTGVVEDAPDLIAATPMGHLALIECTTGILKADKIGRLVERRATLRSRLDASGNRFTKVLGVLISTLARAEVGAGLEAAESQGLLVFAKENLEEAVNMTVVPQDADALFSQAEHKIAELDKLQGAGASTPDN
jgi:hypothetical protein